MKYMVFDVGGTDIKYSVMDEQLNTYASGSVPTPSDNQQHFIDAIEALYLPYKNKVESIAMSLPGFIDSKNGMVCGGGSPSIQYNAGTPVGVLLAERCGCPVWLENDGKAAALAELWQGSLKGCQNAAVFLLGTGAGGGIIINGELLRGRDFTAGEYSFLSTDPENWRDASKTVGSQCSTTNLLRLYREKKHLPADALMNGKIFFAAANAGEADALEVLQSFCFTVAVQIYNLNVLLDLDKIAIGGGISKQPLLVETLNRVYDEELIAHHPYSPAAGRSLPRPEIVTCKFASEANQVGALYSMLKAAGKIN